TWRRAALFGAVFLMNGLTNVHWLLFGSIAIAATVMIVRPRLLPLAVATLAALALLTPFLVPYVEASKLYGMTRHRDEVTQFLATWSDWIHADAAEPERRVFPGLLAIAVGLIAFVVARRRREALSIALLWIVIGIAGSLGAHFFFHQFLFDYVPGFRAIR